MTAGLHAGITPHELYLFVGTAPARNTAEVEGDSNIAEAVVEVDAFIAGKSLAH